MLAPYMQEEQVHDVQQGENMEENTNPAWLDRNSQFSNTIFAVASAILVQLLSGYTSIPELDNHLTESWAWILFLVFLSAGALMQFKCHISGENELSDRQKIILISLALLTGTAVMVANAIFLDIIQKSYLVLATIPVLGFVLITLIFYYELKLGQNQRTLSDSEDHESMVKNCFKLAVATTSVGFAVQTTVIIVGYLKNPKFPKNHPHYNLTVPYITSALGSFVMIITSSPFDIKSVVKYGFLKQIPKVMLVSLCLVAAILSAEFLDPTNIVLAVIVPLFLEIIVKLCQHTGEQPATGETSISTNFVEVDSMFATVAIFGFQVLSTIYSVKLGSEPYGAYLKYSVFFLLMAIITSLIRMVLPFGSTCQRGKTKVIEISLPVVEALVSMALLLTEICTYINGRSILGPLSPLPHYCYFLHARLWKDAKLFNTLSIAPLTSSNYHQLKLI